MPSKKQIAPPARMNQWAFLRSSTTPDTITLMAIIKKRLNLDISLYTILQIVSVTVFNKTPLYQMLTDTEYETVAAIDDNQLKLFE